MIELNTGKITFPELNITLSPLLHSTDFISDFPKDKILRVRDMKNGYIWYDISEKVYDTKIPVDLCFNPQGNLEFIELFPTKYRLKCHFAPEKSDTYRNNEERKTIL